MYGAAELQAERIWFIHSCCARGGKLLPGSVIVLNGVKKTGGFIIARLSFLVTVREPFEFCDPSTEDCLLGLGALVGDCDFLRGEEAEGVGWICMFDSWLRAPEEVR